MQRTRRDELTFVRGGVTHEVPCGSGEELVVYVASARPKLDAVGLDALRRMLDHSGDPYRIVEPTVAGKAQAVGLVAVLAAVLLGGLLVFNGSVLSRRAQGGRLAAGGKTVEATVTGVLKGIGTNSASYVDYTFTPDGGAPVSKHEAADGATAANAAQLKRVTVRYLPSDPSQAQIASNDSDSFTLIAVALLDLAAIGLVVGALLKARKGAAGRGDGRANA